MLSVFLGTATLIGIRCAAVFSAVARGPADLGFPPVATRSFQGHVELAGLLPSERRKGRALT